MRQDSTRQNTHDHFWFQYEFWSVPGTKRNCPVPDRKSTVEGRSNLKIGEKEVHDTSDRWPHLEVERSKVKVTRPLRKSAISSERKVYKLRTWYILQMKYTMTRIAELRGEWPEKSEVKVMTSRRQLDAWQRKVTETPKLAAIAHCDPPIAVNSSFHASVAALLALVLSPLRAQQFGILMPDSLRDPAVGPGQFRRDLKTHLFEWHCVSFSALAVFSRNALYKSTFYLLTYLPVPRSKGQRSSQQMNIYRDR